MSLQVKSRSRDLVDRVYLRAMRRPDLPPYTLRCHVGPVVEYEALPAEYITYFKLLCGLQMDERILDVACGTGRFATQLVGRPHFFCGTYRGFDVDARSIKWANTHVRCDQADISFDHVDVFNEHYNPRATTRAETLVFPYNDAAFDFAFAMSLFTHVTTEVTANYLAEIRRVLRPGGRALVSFVLLDSDITELAPPAINRLYHGVLVDNGLAPDTAPGRVHDLGGYSTLTPDRPAIVTFHPESEVRKLAEDRGLRIGDILYGSWSRTDGGPAFQDLVLLEAV